jgi:hypothetical protein
VIYIISANEKKLKLAPYNDRIQVLYIHNSQPCISSKEVDREASIGGWQRGW